MAHVGSDFMMLAGVHLYNFKISLVVFFLRLIRKKFKVCLMLYSLT